MIGGNLRNSLPVLFQNAFDPQNAVNRRLKVFSHANKSCKRLSLVKKKQRDVPSGRSTERESQMIVLMK